MVSGWSQTAIQWLSANPGWLAAALLLTAFVESLAIAGIIVPGVAILFGIALLAGQTGMALWEVCAWTAVGAILGDGVSFGLGRVFRGRLHTVWPFRRFPGVLDRGERFFQQHGGKSVIVGRFIGPIRPVIPLIAGALAMSGRRFFLFNVLSALGWAPVYVLPGFLVGSTLTHPMKLPPHFYPVLGISLGILALVYVIVFRLRWGLASDSRTYRILRERMNRNHSTGRFWHSWSSCRPGHHEEFPLASLSLALGAGALFLIFTLFKLLGDPALAGDEQIKVFFTVLRNPFLDRPAVAMTMLGDPWLLTFTGFLAISVLTFRGYYAAAVHIGASMVFTLLAVTGFKAWFSVPRPDLVTLPPESWAFPSGHATGIATFTGLASAFLAREAPAQRRWLVYLTLSLPALAVALSRVYLGVHWFSDTIAGLLLGLCICGLIRTSYSRFDQIPIRLDLTTVVATCLWILVTLTYLTLNWPDAMAAYAPLG